MQRKHRVQMTPDEIATVEMTVKSVPSWNSRRHYVTRSRQRAISRRETFEAIALGQCIEAKDNGRALMRHDSGVCVVVEVPSRRIVTVWYNAPDDQHSTLDLSQYQWSTNLTQWSQSWSQPHQPSTM